MKVTKIYAVPNLHKKLSKTNRNNVADMKYWQSDADKRRELMSPTRVL